MCVVERTEEAERRRGRRERLKVNLLIHAINHRHFSGLCSNAKLKANSARGSGAVGVKGQ